MKNLGGLLLASTVGALMLAAQPQAKQRQDLTDYARWSSFPEGAWVTIERDYRGNSKVTITQTLTKKTPDKAFVKEDDEKPKEGDEKAKDDNAAEQPLVLDGLPFKDGQWEYLRVAGAPTCPTCKAVHKEAVISEPKKEKLKVGSKDLVCEVIEVSPFNCQGKREGTSRWWLSKEVPGLIAKRETTAEGIPGKTTDTVLAFDKKKKVSSENK